MAGAALLPEVHGDLALFLALGGHAEAFEVLAGLDHGRPGLQDLQFLREAGEFLVLPGLERGAARVHLVRIADGHEGQVPGGVRGIGLADVHGLGQALRHAAPVARGQVAHDQQDEDRAPRRGQQDELLLPLRVHGGRRDGLRRRRGLFFFCVLRVRRPSQFPLLEIFTSSSRSFRTKRWPGSRTFCTR